VAAAAVVKIALAEAIAVTSPQQRKALPELSDERGKNRDNQRSEASGVVGGLESTADEDRREVRMA
jgi:hypothetical protein